MHLFFFSFYRRIVAVEADFAVADKMLPFVTDHRWCSIIFTHVHILRSFMFATPYTQLIVFFYRLGHATCFMIFQKKNKFHVRSNIEIVENKFKNLEIIF